MFIAEKGRLDNKKSSLLTDSPGQRRNGKLKILIFIIAKEGKTAGND